MISGQIRTSRARRFDPGGLGELAASIRASGVLQPVIASKTGQGYELIAGERRWRAARQAGLERIPVIVREATDSESLELALVENLLREDLNPIEEAEAYQKLLAQFNWTQEELSQKIGKDRSTIANGLRLLRLPEAIQDDLRAGRLTMGHARAFLALDASVRAGQATGRDPRSHVVRAGHRGTGQSASHRGGATAPALVGAGRSRGSPPASAHDPSEDRRARSAGDHRDHLRDGRGAGADRVSPDARARRVTDSLAGVPQPGREARRSASWSG